MDDLVWIGSDRLRAAINPLGAELTHLRDAEDRELMTDADPAFWTGHAPILFPIVGAVYGERITVDGRQYPMRQHGFARRSPFECIARDDRAARFRLRSNDETRAHYPFDFTLTLEYRIDGPILSVAATIANPADRPLPASLGFHPAFAWPLPYGRDRADHRIVFDADEPDPLRTIAADGTISDALRPTPLDGRTLHLADALFDRDALIWDRVRSRAVTYGASDGPQLRIAFPVTPMLGVWTKPAPSGAEGPGARFICIEPWHGIADPEGYAGEFRDKPGVFEVAPGGEWRCSMEVMLES